MSDPRLEPGDVLLTATDSLIGRAIRRYSTERGEGPTLVNHAELVVEGGEFGDAVIVGAVARVSRRTVAVGYADGHAWILVARPVNLTRAELGQIVAAAEARVGERYGYGMIAAHWIDWLAGRVRGKRTVWARRLFRNGPVVCSGLLGTSHVVVEAFRQAELDFGVPGYAAAPDDLYDFIVGSRGRHYVVIRELAPWPDAGEAPLPLRAA